jgi:hypothetical protein
MGAIMFATGALRKRGTFADFAVPHVFFVVALFRVFSLEKKRMGVQMDCSLKGRTQVRS